MSITPKRTKREKYMKIKGERRSEKRSRTLSEHFIHAPIDHVGLNNERQDTKDHQCTLLGDPRDITTKFIDSGMFIEFRRKLRKLTMINNKHPYTKFFASSISRLKQEESRHLILYYYIIHPLSLFSFYFDAFMFLGVLSNMFIAPLVVMHFHGQRDIIFAMLRPSTVLYTLLIIENFVTGYYDFKNNVVVLRKSRIALHYLKTYFLFDLSAIVPQLFRSDLAARAGMVWSVPDNKFVKFAAPIMILCLYFRYFWCLRVLSELRLYFGMSTYAYKALRLVLNTLIIIIVSVYISFTIMREMPNYLNGILVKHIEHTISMLFTVGYGYPTFKEFHEPLIPICFIFIGFLLHLLMLVQGMEIWLKFFSVDNKQTTIYNSTDAYMRYRALPLKLRKRIYLYLDFKHQGYCYKESVIRKVTSAALKKEIHLTVTKESIQKVELFEKCPGLLLNKIRASLTPEIFLPGDVIIKAGSPGQCMFFILAGTVVVTNPENKKLCYLRDGAHFGEIALVINVARVANVIAVTPCELYKLDRHQFWEVMKYHPRIWSEIRFQATDRVAKVSSSMEDQSLFNRTSSRNYADTFQNKSFEIIGEESIVSKYK